MGFATDALRRGESLSTEPDREPPPREVIFDVLSNERRQCILHYLRQQEDRRVDLRDLVDYVTAWENDTTTEAIGTAQRKRVYTAVRQTHLPRLEDAGFVEYEHRRGQVELTEQARRAQMYLEYVPENDIPWSEFYLGLSGFGAALVAATWIGVFPFVALTGEAVAAILVALFAVSAAIHTYQLKRNRIGSDEFDV